MKLSITSKPQLNSERTEASSTLSKRNRYLLPDCIKPLKYFTRTANASLVSFIQPASTHTVNSRTDFFGELTLYRCMRRIDSQHIVTICRCKYRHYFRKFQEYGEKSGSKVCVIRKIMAELNVYKNTDSTSAQYGKAYSRVDYKAPSTLHPPPSTFHEKSYPRKKGCTNTC